mmetsp:Transcript_77863/g.200476  ORF Transcript_77863/g.200476 Transcript_77863/m.200476 type:complete len:229 (-) Transcript_77863:1308-1994(-)
MAMPRPFCWPGSQDTTSPSTALSHVFVIIGPGAFMATTTGLPMATYFLMRATSSACSCSVGRSVPSLALVGTTTARTTSACAASELPPSAWSGHARLPGPLLRPSMPAFTLTFPTLLQEGPFQPLPPPIASGSAEQASLPIRATFVFFDRGSTPPLFFNTTVDSTMILSASASLHGDLTLSAPRSAHLWWVSASRGGTACVDRVRPPAARLAGAGAGSEPAEPKGFDV